MSMTDTRRVKLPGTANGSSETGSPAWAIRARRILGAGVVDPAGRRIGEIADVILDLQSGAILFAVIGFGGFLGMAEKYYPMRWNALAYDASEGRFVANCTRDRFLASPAHSVDWMMERQGLHQRDPTRDYYKALQYWESH